MAGFEIETQHQMHKQILIDGSVRTDGLFLLGEDGELECLNGLVDS